jgi:hypothetical protein
MRFGLQKHLLKKAFTAIVVSSEFKKKLIAMKFGLQKHLLKKKFQAYIV